MSIWQTTKFIKKVSPNIAVFSKFLSDLYDESWYGYLTEDEIRFFFAFVKNKRSLEIGSGTGRISFPLLRLGCDLYGIEGSSEMYNVLQSRLDRSQKDRFILWDARQIPYPADDQTFEAILIPFSTFGLLHNHVKDLGENRMFHEFNRLLQSKGLLIINDYRVSTFQEEFSNDPNPVEIFYHDHPVHGLVREVQESHFKEVPNRLLPHQMMRERRIKFIREKDGVALEEHCEGVPLWYPHDYRILGQDADFEYIKGESCQFHKDSSMLHIFQKNGNR
jgi:ubiquinone/menaquinone biosynthesis C-methylase UbiE